MSLTIEERKRTSEIISMQRHLFSMAFLSRMIMHSINNIEEYFALSFDVPHEKTIGLLKKSYHKSGHLEKDMTESQKAYFIPYEETINFFNKKPIENIRFFNTIVMSSIIQVGDLLGQKGLYGVMEKGNIKRNSISPEIEFMRHIRNGIAHGNKFKVYEGQIYFEAKFNELVISEKLTGCKIIPTDSDLDSFMEVGDVYELFDIISYQIENKT